MEQLRSSHHGQLWNILPLWTKSAATSRARCRLRTPLVSALREPRLLVPPASITVTQRMDYSDISRDIALHDNRTAVEKFFLIYPRTWSDFDDAEAEGLFVPRWHHGIYAILWAVALTLLRYAFDRFGPAVLLFNCCYCGGGRARSWWCSLV